MAKCNWILLCEDFARHAENRFDILGVYTELHPQTVPCMVSKFTVVVEFSAQPGEVLEADLAILDPGGSTIESEKIAIPVETARGVLHWLFQRERLVLPTYGLYSIRITTADQETTRPVPVMA